MHASLQPILQQQEVIQNPKKQGEQQEIKDKEQKNQQEQNQEQEQEISQGDEDDIEQQENTSSSWGTPCPSCVISSEKLNNEMMKILCSLTYLTTQIEVLQETVSNLQNKNHGHGEIDLSNEKKLDQNGKNNGGIQKNLMENFNVFPVLDSRELETLALQVNSKGIRGYGTVQQTARRCKFQASRKESDVKGEEKENCYYIYWTKSGATTNQYSKDQEQLIGEMFRKLGVTFAQQSNVWEQGKRYLQLPNWNLTLYLTYMIRFISKNEKKAASNHQLNEELNGEQKRKRKLSASKTKTKTTKTKTKTKNSKPQLNVQISSKKITILRSGKSTSARKKLKVGKSKKKEFA